jgi:hypothetical protein
MGSGVSQLPLLPEKPVQTKREFVRERIEGFGMRQLAREARRRSKIGRARRPASAVVQERLKLE